MTYSLVQDISKQYKKNKKLEVEIYARNLVSLNGRSPAKIINSKVDLTKINFNLFTHNTWITNHSSKYEVGQFFADNIIKRKFYKLETIFNYNYTFLRIAQNYSQRI